MKGAPPFRTARLFIRRNTVYILIIAAAVSLFAFLPLFKGRIIHSTPISSDLSIKVYKSLTVSDMSVFPLSLAANSTLFYVDAWRAHWCPYYNDREFFLSPRINELLHLLRSRGFKILHLHWKGDPSQLDESQRKSCQIISKRGMIPVIEKSYPWNGINNSRDLKGFQDQCMYPNFSNFGPTRRSMPNPNIAVSSEDVIASSFKGVAAVANAMKISNVVMMGMHTNLCILSATMYLELLNVSLGYVTDLLDSGYFYPGQKKAIQSHGEMNKVCNDLMTLHHGWGIEVYDLMNELMRMPPTIREPKWTLFGDKVDPFRRYYLPLATK